MTLSRSVNVSIRAARIEIEETVRMSCMYCGRMMLEIKLRAVLMLSKCQVSSFLYKVNSEKNAGDIQTKGNNRHLDNCFYFLFIN